MGSERLESKDRGRDGGAGVVVVLTVSLTFPMLPTDAVTVYSLAGLFPNVSVVDARPPLSVVELVGLNDAAPSSGLTLNVTVWPDLLPSVTSAVNVTVSPGWKGPPDRLMYSASGSDGGTIATGGGGGGGTAPTVTVTLLDALPADTVIVYEPDALLPNLTVADDRPLLLVVVLRVRRRACVTDPGISIA